MWKEFFYFNKSERRAVILLSFILVLSILISILLTRNGQKDGVSYNPETLEKFEAYTVSIQEKKSYKKNQERKTTLHPRSFDPNTAKEETFIQIGLPQWMVKNILKYRAKGGLFRKPEDFKKIYGLTTEQFNTLLPYIYIGEEFAPSEKSGRGYTDKQVYPRMDAESNCFASDKKSHPNNKRETDSTERHYSTYKIGKYAAGTLVDLNRADTTELQHIPGIGIVTARRIINYKKELGGFYSAKQLLEIDASYEKFISWFKVDSTCIIPLDINKASIERLMQHPYLNFYQAKAIDEHRKYHGPFKNIQEVSMYDEFSEQDIARLKSYLLF